MLQTNVVFDGCPHGFGAECACTPCGALRNAANRLVTEEVQILYASILPLPPLEAASPTEHPLLGVLPAACRALVDGAVVHSGGIWAQKRVDIASRQKVHHLKFTYRCRVRIITLTRARVEETKEEDEDVQALDFPEQWVSCAQAVDVVSRFWESEEVYLKEGDVAWITEAAGATIMRPRAEAALWNYDRVQFHVQIENAQGRPLAWKTLHLKAWIKGMYVAQRLPRALLTSGLWVVVCFLRTGERLKVRINTERALFQLPSTISKLSWVEL